MIYKITDDEFSRLVSFIHTEYGINLANKRALIEGRLSGELNQRGFSAYSQYLNVVYKDKTGTEVVSLLNKLTTNHTYFMREPEHYDFMEQTFLPYIKSLNRPRKYVRIWSAGCSSGEEAYTTQMLMLEHFGRQSTLWDTTISATDISEKVLDKARQGVYHSDSMKNLDPAWVETYFTPAENSCYRIKPALSERVKFSAFNLMKPIPRPIVPYDLVFCRNVMIYFDQATKLDLVKRFYDVIAPGGYLFIGHAESVPREATDFEYVKPAIYRRPLK